LAVPPKKAGPARGCAFDERTQRQATVAEQAERRDWEAVGLSAVTVEVPGDRSLPTAKPGRPPGRLFAFQRACPRDLRAALGTGLMSSMDLAELGDAVGFTRGRESGIDEPSTTGPGVRPMTFPGWPHGSRRTGRVLHNSPPWRVRPWPAAATRDDAKGPRFGEGRQTGTPGKSGLGARAVSVSANRRGLTGRGGGRRNSRPPPAVPLSVGTRPGGWCGAGRCSPRASSTRTVVTHRGADEKNAARLFAVPSRRYSKPIGSLVRRKSRRWIFARQQPQKADSSRPLAIPVHSDNPPS